jgi:type IV pilus assembly protein PilA
MKNEQGFSLVELLIVVAIIAIIAAIAVPSLLTSRQAANEASAIQACRTLGSAEIAFSATTNQQYGTMPNLVTGNFIDSRFVEGTTIGGYRYADDTAITSDTGLTVGGAAPTMFGFYATGQAGGGRFDYQIGVDQVVRWGTQKPTSGTANGPIGK